MEPGLAPGRGGAIVPAKTADAALALALVHANLEVAQGMRDFVAKPIAAIAEAISTPTLRVLIFAELERSSACLISP